MSPETFKAVMASVLSSITSIAVITAIKRKQQQSLEREAPVMFHGTLIPAPAARWLERIHRDDLYRMRSMIGLVDEVQNRVAYRLERNVTTDLDSGVANKLTNVRAMANASTRLPTRPGSLTHAIAVAGRGPLIGAMRRFSDKLILSEVDDSAAINSVLDSISNDAANLTKDVEAGIFDTMLSYGIGDTSILEAYTEVWVSVFIYEVARCLYQAVAVGPCWNLYKGSTPYSKRPMHT